MFIDVGLEGCGQDYEELLVEIYNRFRGENKRNGEKGEEIVEEEEEKEISKDREENKESSNAESDPNRFNEYIKEKHTRIIELRG